MAKRIKQLNIRLSPADFEALEAAAFVHELTPSALLTDIAEEAIDGLRREPEVKEALKLRLQAKTARSATVSPIDAGRTVRRRRKR